MSFGGYAIGHVGSYELHPGPFLNRRDPPCHGHGSRIRGVVGHEVDRLHDPLAENEINEAGIHDVGIGRLVSTKQPSEA